AQCTENVGGVAIILRGRYDVRAFFLCVSMALRLTAIAVAASHGLTATIVAIVAAQVVATAAVDTAGWIAYRRFPQQPSVPLGDALVVVVLPPMLVFTPEIARFVFTSKISGAVDAMRLVIAAGALRLVYGWTKSFPVSIGRPSLRIWTHGLEMLVLIPLVGIL